MTDPLSTYEAAEADAVERQDEARREQHWREAEQAARSWLLRWRVATSVVSLLVRLTVEELMPAADADARTLQVFRGDYGTPALLRVIANALEAK